MQKCYEYKVHYRNYHPTKKRVQKMLMCGFRSRYDAYMWARHVSTMQENPVTVFWSHGRSDFKNGKLVFTSDRK